MDTVRLSFFEADKAGALHFAGLANFRRLLGDPLWSEGFWNALLNTCVFFGIHMVVQNGIGLALAGPNFSTGLLGIYFYRTFFGYQLQVGNPQMGATVASAMFVIILAGVALYYFAVQRRMQRHAF